MRVLLTLTVGAGTASPMPMPSPPMDRLPAFGARVDVVGEAPATVVGAIAILAGESDLLVRLTSPIFLLARPTAPIHPRSPSRFPTELVQSVFSFGHTISCLLLVDNVSP